MHVFLPQRATHVGCGQIQCGHAHRIEPHPQRHRLIAVDRCLGDAGQCLQAGYDTAQGVVRHLRGVHVFAHERQIDQRPPVAGGQADDRILGLAGQAVTFAGDLALNLGQGIVGVVVEGHVRLDDGHTLPRVRGDVVDAVRFGGCPLQGLGDERLHQVGVGTGECRGDHNQRLLGFRVFAQFKRCDRAQTQQQDEQADHAGEHRPAHEHIGDHQPSSMSVGSGMPALVTTR